MVPILVVLLLQSAPPAGQAADLPVSLDRVHEGLARPSRFPPPADLWRSLFRVKIEQPVLIFEDPWAETSMTPPWVRPPTSPTHFDFLSAVTPEEVRSATLYPCCDVLPLVRAVNGMVGRRVRAAREARAKREVEQAMREAGIRRQPD